MLDTRVPDDWFVGFHQGLAARFWHAAGEAMAADDVRIVAALLPRGAVLDVPCGDGRLAAQSRLESEYVFTGPDGETEQVRAAHHVHTTGEVVRLLRAAGFDRVELRGDGGTRPYELGDRRMIALAT